MKAEVDTAWLAEYFQYICMSVKIHNCIMVHGIWVYCAMWCFICVTEGKEKYNRTITVVLFHDCRPIIIPYKMENVAYMS